MNLLIGSGDWSWGDGWISIDGDPQSHADIIAMVPPLPDAVKGRMYDQILAAHFIEHLTKTEALALLRECYVILAPGGVLTLEQPDLAYCCKIIAGIIAPPEGRTVEQFGYWGVFGRPAVHPLMGHKHGYTPQTLTDLIIEAGFSLDNITISPGGYHEPVRDFTLTAVKGNVFEDLHKRALTAWGDQFYGDKK